MYFGNLINNPWMAIFLVLIIVENVQYYLNSPDALLALILSIPGMLIAITFHEYAHAFVADKLGDDTPRKQGRLTLNPLAHLDSVGVLLLLFAGFGWGKPVQINSHNFNRKITIKEGNALVSFAGPAMNFILAILFSVIYGLLIAFASNFIFYNMVGKIIATIIQCIITMNVGLGVFNLIPLPPLDGSKILLAFLPKKAQNWYESKQKILYIIFLVVWLTPLASMVVSPFINIINSSLLNLISLIAGK